MANITRAILDEKMAALGWGTDRFGHYNYKTASGKRFRLKVLRSSVRFELKGPGKDDPWIRIAGCRFSKIQYHENHVQVELWRFGWIKDASPIRLAQARPMPRV